MNVPGDDAKCWMPWFNQSVFYLVEMGSIWLLVNWKRASTLVIYREGTDDGFIITAFVTRRVRSLVKRRQVWP